MALAIFDLDNTLLNGDSDHAWGEFMVAKGCVDGAHYREQNDRFYRQYQAGTLDIHAYLEFALTPLTQFSASDLKQLHDEFMASHIAPMRQTKADALLEKHRQQGDFLLIITATNGFITRPIAHWLGVDDILATEPEIINGRYTGKASGVPCFQEGKVERLKNWLVEQSISLEDSYFYSDSINDLPLLRMVDNPIVVDGDPKLQSIAHEKRWPCISLHD